MESENAAFSRTRWPRFLIHVLPNGFHRIRHYGLLASGSKAETIARARELIAAATSVQTAQKQQAADSAAATEAATDKPVHPCPCCGDRMAIIETFEAGRTPRHQPTATASTIRIDTS
jgi:Putative transposase